MIGSIFETNPAGFDQVSELHDLLRAAFAPMVGRIDPPSSLTAMTQADVAGKIESEDFFLIRQGRTPIACVFGHSETGAYEVGKLAVASSHLRQGLARALIDVAGEHAKTLGHATLQLYARVELTENHAVYRALGFAQTATFTHDGFAQPTAFVFQRPL